MLTIFLVMRCIHEYRLDKDISQVEYRSFHSMDGFIYPSFSICFHQPFLEDKIDHLGGKEFGWIHYLSFLAGDYWDEALLKIDCDDVTADLAKHFLEIAVELEKDQQLFWKISDNSFQLTKAHRLKNTTKEKIASIKPPKFYVSYRSFWKKCFAIDMPFIKNEPIVSFRVEINGSIFKHGIRPNKNEFSVAFHYPNQNLNSFSAQTAWESKYNESLFYEMYISVAYLEVLNRRNKPSMP